MTAAVTPSSPRDSSGRLIVGTLLASVLLHAGALAWLSGRERPLINVNKPMEMVMVEVEPPKPPPPPEEVKPEPEKPKPPPPVKVARTEKPPPPDATPPPPNEPAPEPTKPVPLIVGVTMSSTTSAGGFAAPVGNTAYGKAEGQATNPADVKAYAAPKYVAPGSSDTEPQVAQEFKIPYPPEAKRAGIEGTVRLKIVVDDQGRVVDVQLVSGPGYGLNEAAKEALKRFKFKPAIKGGEAVSTSMVYNYTFLLD